MAKRYYRWEHPTQPQGKREWVEMTGKEYYAFVSSPEGQRRYFVHDEDLVIEADKAYFVAWRKEKDHSDYLREQAEGLILLSLYGCSLEDGCNGEDVIADNTQNTEETAIQNIRLRALREALKTLPEKDLRLIHSLYYEMKTEREVAGLLGVSQPAVHKRRKKIRDQLRFLVIKFEKSSQ